MGRITGSEEGPRRHLHGGRTGFRRSARVAARRTGGRAGKRRRGGLAPPESPREERPSGSSFLPESIAGGPNPCKLWIARATRAHRVACLCSGLLAVPLCRYASCSLHAGGPRASNGPCAAPRAKHVRHSRPRATSLLPGPRKAGTCHVCSCCSWPGTRVSGIRRAVLTPDGHPGTTALTDPGTVTSRGGSGQQRHSKSGASPSTGPAQLGWLVVLVSRTGMATPTSRHTTNTQGLGGSRRMASYMSSHSIIAHTP